MKRINFVIGIILLTLSNIMVSCTTTMNFDKSATLRESMHGTNTEMEFIGFKGTYDTLGSDYDIWQNFKKDTVLAKLGAVLQDKGIVYDQSFAYFGMYSLQEIATYKSKQRYVTFVDTEKNNFTYVYNDIHQQIWVGIGSGFAIGGLVYTLLTKQYTLGLIFSSAGLVSFLPALIPGKTTVTFNGVYSIYVYDTENKEIIYKDTVSVGPLIDKYSGSYEHPDTNKNAVWNYYSTLAFNEIIKKYGEVYQFLETKK